MLPPFSENGSVKKVKKLDTKKLAKLTNPFIPIYNMSKDWQMLCDDVAISIEKLRE